MFRVQGFDVAGEDETVVIGRAFINCSILHNKVLKVSYVRSLNPMMVFSATNEMFRDATQMWCIGRTKFSGYLVVSENWFTELLLPVVIRSFSAAVKFVALSERFSKGVPLLAKKRRSAVRVASDDRS